MSIRCLLQKDIKFVWDDPQTKAFQKVKSIITWSAVLDYFEPKLPLILEADASKNGIGVCLIQQGHSIAYVNYAQIEKELLAIPYGCKRFHQYTYGSHTEVHSDHIPISSIIKNICCSAT